jgi:hypothetical protein
MQAILLDLKLPELTQLPCLTKVVYGANLTRLGVGFTGAPRLSVTGYDDGFDQMISDCLLIAYSLLEQPIPIITNNAIDMMARPIVNAMIAAEIAK